MPENDTTARGSFEVTRLDEGYLVHRKQIIREVVQERYVACLTHETLHGELDRWLQGIHGSTPAAMRMRNVLEFPA